MDERVLRRARDSELVCEVGASIFHQCWVGRLRTAEVLKHTCQNCAVTQKALIAPTDYLGQETCVGGKDGETCIL